MEKDVIRIDKLLQTQFTKITHVRPKVYKYL